MITHPRAAVSCLIALLCAPQGLAELPGGASAGEPETQVQPFERPAARADCGFSGSLDPDGDRRRRSAARTTQLFAPAHPAALALSGPLGAVGSGGITGLKSRIPHRSFIDDEILGAMDAAKVPYAPLSSDAEFLRRVTLDLTGRIPDATVASAFLADTKLDKRATMIDRLLASDAFADRWAQYFDDLFRNTFNADSGKLGVDGRNKLHAYFVDALRSGKPYDVMARELITAAGETNVTGAPNFEARNVQTNGPPQDTLDNLASETGGVFMGVNIFCTSCHNGAGHTDSINLWLSTVKRSDFWGMSAFYARTAIRRQGQFPDSYYIVGDRLNGDYQLNTTTGNKTTRDGTWANGATVITPKYLLGGGTPQSGESYRAALARLLTTDPQFARAAANRFWKEMFGVGIVEPVNDFDLLRQDPASPPPAPWGIQPTHPNLIKRLGEELAGHGFDVRSLLRLIARSSAYQLSSYYPYEWKEDYARYFARHYARRLRAEEMFDAITKATNVPASLPVRNYPAPVAWAGQLPDVTEPLARQSASVRQFLDAFQRGDRDTEPRSSQGSITQALVSLNDPNVTERVKATVPGSVTNRLVTANLGPEETVKTLYLATLSRPPSASELATGVAMFQGLKPGQTVASVTEDLQFALLNKLDFLFCY